MSLCAAHVCFWGQSGSLHFSIGDLAVLVPSDAAAKSPSHFCVYQNPPIETPHSCTEIARGARACGSGVGTGCMRWGRFECVSLSLVGDDKTLRKQTNKGASGYSGHDPGLMSAFAVAIGG
jgi:hypothetical protein